jgi:hypothetical protein
MQARRPSFALVLSLSFLALVGGCTTAATPHSQNDAGRSDARRDSSPDDDAATCGTVGVACCEWSTCRSADLGCLNGTCQSATCGNLSQACCSGSTCVPTLTCQNNTCQSSTCGALGQACCGGTTCQPDLSCQSATCQPVSRNPVALASGCAALGLAVNGWSAFWSTGGATDPDWTIQQMALTSTTPVTTATEQTAAYDIVVSSASIYWVRTEAAGSIMKAPLAGGTATAAATNQAYPAMLAIDATYLYWSNRGSAADGAIMRMPLAGGAPVVLASGQAGPLGVAVDAANLYWANYGTAANSYTDGTIMKLPLTAVGSPTLLASAQSHPFHVAIDSTSVYWTTFYAGGSVQKVPLAGGAVTTLATAQNFPAGIAVDGTSVYWSTSGTSGASFRDGTIMKVPLAGGSPTTLASAQFTPGVVTLDGTNVYWTNFGTVDTQSTPLRDGAVMKVAK